MAQTKTLLGFQRGSGGFLSIQVALAADPYVNGTGLSVSIADQITHHPWHTFRAFLAQASTGHSVYVTKSATPGVLNVRLFNGIVEVATGNVTTTLQITGLRAPYRV